MGASGAQLFTNVNGMPLDHPGLAPIFDAVVGRFMTGLDRDRGGLAPLVRHPPRSVLILSA